MYARVKLRSISREWKIYILDLDARDEFLVSQIQFQFRRFAFQDFDSDIAFFSGECDSSIKWIFVEKSGLGLWMNDSCNDRRM